MMVLQRPLQFLLLFPLAALSVPLEVDDVAVESADASTFENYRLLQANPSSEKQLNLLRNMEASSTDGSLLEFWSHPAQVGQAVQLSIHPDVVPAVEILFKSQHLKHEVLTDNLQGLIEGEMKSIQAKASEGEDAEGLNYRDPSKSNFDEKNYNRLKTISLRLAELEKESGGVLSVRSIGVTSEGRPIEMATLGSGPAFVVDCGIHAREWISPSFCMFALEQLLAPSSEGLLREFEFNIIPVMNPDGYEFSWNSNRMWRKNRSTGGKKAVTSPSSVLAVEEVDKATWRQFWGGQNPGTFGTYPGGISQFPGFQPTAPPNRPQGPGFGSKCAGVDPNRNFATRHYGVVGSSGSPCRDTYHGPNSFSEAESQALRDVIQGHQKVACYMSVHAYSQLWMSPYGHSKEHTRDYEDHQRVMKIATEALYQPYKTVFKFGPVNEVIYRAAGSSVDWAYDVGVKYSFALELRDTGRHGFLLPVDQIGPTNLETWLGFNASAWEIAKEF